jgi:WD40 repeat protein
MSIISVVQDYRNLLAARAVEVSLTTAALRALQERFSQRGGATRGISSSAFLALLQPLLAPLPAEHRERYCSEPHLAAWFHALDADMDGLVNWGTFIDAVSKIAAQRRHRPVYPALVRSRSWAHGNVDQVIYVDSWRRLIAVGMNDSPDIHLLSQAGTPQAKLSGHTAAPLALHFARDAGRLITSSCDRGIIVWDHKRMQPGASVVVESPVSCMQYDAASELVYCALLSGFIVAYPLSLAAPVHTSAAVHDDWVIAMDVVPELQQLVTASRDRTIGLWSTDGLELVRKLVGHTRPVAHVVYIERQRLLFSAGQGTELFAWSPVSLSAAPVASLLGHDRDIVGLFADAVGNTITTVDASSRVIVWSTAKLASLQVVDPGTTALHLAPLHACCQDPISRQLYLYSLSQFSHVTPKLPSHRPPKLGQHVVALLFDERTFLLLVVTASALHMVSADTGQLVRTIESPLGHNVLAEGCFKSDRVLFIYSASGRLVLYRLGDALKAGSMARVALPEGTAPIAAMFQNADAGPAHHSMVCRDGSVHIGTIHRQLREWGFLRNISLPAVPPSQLWGDAGRASAGSHRRAPHVVCANDVGHGELFVLFKQCAVAMVVNVRSTAREFFDVDAGHGSPRGAAFLPHRNAVVVLFAEGIVVYNCGSYVKLVEVVDIGLERTAIPRIIAAGPDAVAFTSQTGTIRTLPLHHLFEQFLVTQNAGAMAAGSKAAPEKAARRRDSRIKLSAIAGTLLALSEGVAPRKGPFATVYAVFHSKTNNEYMLKAHADGDAHAAEAAARFALGDACNDTVVRFFEDWDDAQRPPEPPLDGTLPVFASEHEMPSASFHEQISGRLAFGGGPGGIGLEVQRAIIMEKGVLRLSDLIKLGTWSMAEREAVLFDVVRIAAAVQRAGYVMVDTRPRHFVRVGSRWKLCGLDGLTAIGDQLLPHGAATYCAPEMTEVESRKVSATLKAAASVMNWAVACIAFEIVVGRPLISATNDKEAIANVKVLEHFGITGHVKTVAGLSKLGGLIVKHMLVVNPAKRGSAAYVLGLMETLVAESSASDDDAEGSEDDDAPEDLDGVVMLPHNREQVVPMPRAFSSHVVNAVNVTAVDHVESHANEQMHRVDFAACNAAGTLVFCADVAPTGGNRGAIHMYDVVDRRHCGLWPQPDVGKDPAQAWRLPPRRLTSLSKRGMILNKDEGGDDDQNEAAQGDDAPPPPGDDAAGADAPALGLRHDLVAAGVGGAARGPDAASVGGPLDARRLAAAARAEGRARRAHDGGRHAGLRGRPHAPHAVLLRHWREAPPRRGDAALRAAAAGADAPAAHGDAQGRDD